MLDLIDYTHPYFNERNISIKTCKKFQVGFDFATDSIALPIYNLSGTTIIGIQCRKLKGKPKYDYILKCNKSDTFFGTQHIKDWSSIILVEGAFGVLNLYDKGFKNIIGTLGSPSDSQINTINKISSNPILIFDNDEAGARMVHKFAKQCTVPCLVPSVNYGEVDELSKSNIEQIINNLKPLQNSKRAREV